MQAKDCFSSFIQCDTNNSHTHHIVTTAPEYVTVTLDKVNAMAVNEFFNELSHTRFLVRLFETLDDLLTPPHPTFLTRRLRKQP